MLDEAYGVGVGAAGGGGEEKWLREQDLQLEREYLREKEEVIVADSRPKVRVDLSALHRMALQARGIRDKFSDVEGADHGGILRNSLGQLIAPGDIDINMEALPTAA